MADDRVVALTNRRQFQTFLLDNDLCEILNKSVWFKDC